jgi:hypothetical protein
MERRNLDGEVEVSGWLSCDIFRIYSDIDMNVKDNAEQLTLFVPQRD